MKANQYEPVTEWIKKEKIFLYKLGHAFTEDESIIEEAVKQTLNDIKGLDNFSEEDIKIKFVNECLKLQHLDKTSKNDKTIYQQCLYLKYALHMNTEKIAHYLSVSDQTIEKYIILGLESLVEEEQLRSCETTIRKLISYHEGLLSFSDYKEVNDLLTINEHCRNLLERLIEIIDEFQRLERTLEPSQYFLEANKPLSEAEIKKKKLRQRIFTITASIFLLVGIIISSIGLEELKHKWKLWTSEQVAFGENVYISAIDQNIEITVTHVAADDTNTILYYEIRDINDEFHYNTEAYQDMFEIIEKDIWDGHRQDFYSRPRTFTRVLDKDSVSQGRIFLPAIKNPKENVTVRFYTVEQFKKGIDLYGHYDPRDRKRVSGDWILEVPITKYEPVTVEIDETLEIMGKEVYLSHLELAPTATFLVYKIENKVGSINGNHILSFSFIEADGQKYGPDFEVDLWNGREQLGSWERLFPFQTMYFKQPKELDIVLDRMHSNYEYEQELLIDYENLPMEIPFLDTFIKVTAVEMGNPFILTIDEEVDANRSYDQFHLNFHGGHQNISGYGMSSEGVWFDNQGNIYKNYDEVLELDFEIQNELRFVSTEQKIEILFHDKNWDESMLPEKFLINGYSKIHIVPDRVKVQLN